MHGVNASAYDGRTRVKLTGNTILVTGGGSRIGRAFAEEFAPRGYKVVIVGRLRDALDAAVYRQNGIESIVLDIHRPPQPALRERATLRRRSISSSRRLGDFHSFRLM
jgi:NAD(P)-dependent dehydrogenase (short-subunit alcohol dehydrogenase family)